ncbi:MAG: DUF2281 domain-containing protein [Bdellovibrio bacteriovorus]
MTAIAQELIDKLKQLPPHKVAEVEDFVDFLRARQDESRLTRAMSEMAEASFAQAWDNDEDAAYDRL